MALENNKSNDRIPKTNVNGTIAKVAKVIANEFATDGAGFD